VKYLIIGGPRQGEWTELTDKPSGATWVDLLSAETYTVRWINYAIAGPIAGVAAELWRLGILVHPSFRGPMEGQFVQMGWMQVIAQPHIDAFMRQHGQAQQMAEPELPPIPDTPAEIVDGA
jgi:hypothetical protein